MKPNLSNLKTIFKNFKLSNMIFKKLFYKTYFNLILPFVKLSKFTK